MLNKFTKYLTEFTISVYPEITSDKAEQIEYGLYMIISDGIKLLAISLISLILGIFNLSIIAVIVFSLCKTYFGGAHANTQIKCFMIHFIVIFSTVFVSQAISSKILLLFFLVSGFLFYKFAPADTLAKPILTYKRWQELRIRGFVLLCIFFLVACIVPVCYANVITVIVFICALNITPVAYKISNSKKGGMVNVK